MRPQLIELRVVSLPAAQSKTQLWISSRVSLSPSISALTSAWVSVSPSLPSALPAMSSMSPAGRSTGAKERFERVLSLRHEFGIALAEDDVRHVEDELVLTRDAHHVADDLDGSHGARRDEVAARAGFLQTMNDRLRCASTSSMLRCNMRGGRRLSLRSRRVEDRPC